MGNIKTLGDTYQFAVDVSDFSPEDIIITTSKNQIEVRAEKVSGLLLGCPSVLETTGAIFKAELSSPAGAEGWGSPKMLG